MGRERRDVDGVEGPAGDHPLAHERAAGPSQDDHEVNVMVLLKARVTAGFELEVAKLPRGWELIGPDECLAADAGEVHTPRCGAIGLLVGRGRHVRPPEQPRVE
jgi:hypothetical protein